MVAGMELKVWVEGIQRIVCGVTETTTCQDVVYALAHATGKTGRFTLIERWRSNERLLAPNEYPLKILLKWGEYSNDVQFILQRSALEPKASNGPSSTRPGGAQRIDSPSRAPLPQSKSPQTTNTQDRPRHSPHTNKDLKKSLTFSGGHADLRRQDPSTPSPSLPGPGPPLLQTVGPPTVLRHGGEYPYPPSPTSRHWEGEGSRAGQHMSSTWRPAAPPPYELVCGNPPLPPPPSGPRLGLGVDNVRATSHWGAPWPASHPSQGPLHHYPDPHSPTHEPPYSLSRRDQRGGEQAQQVLSPTRSEPVYSEGRHAPYHPSYTHQASSTSPLGPHYHHAPSPSQISPNMYNGPPPPKLPHIPGPRELPPYRHPPPPSASPTKIALSHSSPRKPIKIPTEQTSPGKQQQQQQQQQQPPHPHTHPHPVASSPHSSPIRHPSPNNRHPSPTWPPPTSIVPSSSPHIGPRNARSGSPVKAIQRRLGLADDYLGMHDRASTTATPTPTPTFSFTPNPTPTPNPATAIHKPGGVEEQQHATTVTATPQQQHHHHHHHHHAKKDEVLFRDSNNTLGKITPTNTNIITAVQDQTQLNRGTIERLGMVGVYGSRRGTNDEPLSKFSNKDSSAASSTSLNSSEHILNTSHDSNSNININMAKTTITSTTPTNHSSIKSPHHNRRSPTKSGSGVVVKEGGHLNHNNKVEEVVIDSKYRDLIKVINLQRGKLNSQQVELTKYEAEIAYLEGRSREEESRLSHVTSEIERHEKLAQQIDQEVSHIQQLEQDAESAHQTEDKVKAEISALQAQLAHCENQLSAHMDKAQELEQSVSEEQQRTQEEAKAQQEAMLREIDKLHAAIAQANAQAEHAQLQSQQILQEMTDSEKTISDKKREVEKLVMEMKDANLESLSITPSEEVQTLMEGKTGASKPGSSRRMIGSPRQLENAVPTSKNPHGVWV